MLARKKKILSANIFNRALSEMYKNLIHIASYNILTARKKIIKNPKFAEKWERTFGEVRDIVSQTVEGKNSSGMLSCIVTLRPTFRGHTVTGGLTLHPLFVTIVTLS
jgi:hypothetical protein